MCSKKFLGSVVKVAAKFCRRCHRLTENKRMFCPDCGSMDLQSCRCRVDRRDLKAYEEAFKV